MTDPDNLLASMSAFRERPPPPSGPRLRGRNSTNPLLETPSSPQFALRETPTSSLYSPTSSSSPTPSIKDFTTLGVISEHPEQPPPLSPTFSEPSPPSPEAAPVVKPISKPTTLTPPPTINYDSVPVQWKALPMEAAVWTFTSQELQQIVSRAIRSSAQESFIRLLSVDVLDRQLPEELERLSDAKLRAQSRYRFCVHRRTMLLQGINACSTVAPDKSGSNISHLGQLAVQLSENSAECDRLLEELLRIVDQQTQVAKLQDNHWASALAVALRKLNGSYGKRTAELKAARQKIAELEAQLEDAWKEAEKMAKEMDDKDSLVGSDEEEADVVMAEHLRILKSPPAVLHDLPSISEPNSPPLPLPSTSQPYMDSPQPEPRPSSSLEHSLSAPPPAYTPTPSTSPSTVADLPVLAPPFTAPADLNSTDDNDNDTATIHSLRSVRSARSMRSVRSTRSTRDSTRVSQVFAARRRSIRASLSSLRLPKLRGKSQGRGHPEPQPPVPDLPPHIRPSISSSTKSPFAHLPEPLTLRKDMWPRIREAPIRGSVDDINLVPRSPKHQPPKPAAMDDIEILPGRAKPDASLVALVAQYPPPPPLPPSDDHTDNDLFLHNHHGKHVPSSLLPHRRWPGNVRGVSEHTPLTMPVPDPNPTGDNPSNTTPRSPQETWEVEQMAARRRDVGNSIGTAVESVLEFFENLGDSVSPKKQPQKKEKAKSLEETPAQAPPPVDQKFAEPPPRV
ncbi:hypothetical protein ONZ45_g15184 [Pleurotus djamor]|nr:hypothetical protein ONZ45_g15184 [Pleurotus djamor]